MNMNPTKTYLFFDSKSKKPKKPTQQTAANHSRSLSAKSDIGKNSARNKLVSQKQLCLPLSKKQKQIRQAIQYRFKRSKMRDYCIELRNQRDPRDQIRDSSSNSSDIEEFREMKQLKIVNLKQYHDKQLSKKLQEKQKNSIKNRLKIRTDTSLIIKTEGSDKSLQKLKFLKSYLQPQTPTKLQTKLKAAPGTRGLNNGTSNDWKFISIQIKQKSKKNEKESKSKSKQIKINSHRTLTVEKNEKTRLKSTESQWQFVPKLKDLTKFNKKYRF